MIDMFGTNVARYRLPGWASDMRKSTIDYLPRYWKLDQSLELVNFYMLRATISLVTELTYTCSGGVVRVFLDGSVCALQLRKLQREDTEEEKSICKIRYVWHPAAWEYLRYYKSTYE